jgi:hypothetical protein
MADCEAIEKKLAEAEQRLRELTDVVAKRDCAGRSHGPAMSPEVMQEIDDLEERIGQLKKELAA